MTIAAENCIVETKFIASDVGFLEKINSVVALPKDKTENIKGITKLSLYLLNNICATSQENKNIVIPFNASEIIKSIFNALLNVTDFCSKLFSLLFASRCLFSERLCSIAGSALHFFSLINTRNPCKSPRRRVFLFRICYNTFFHFLFILQPLL